MINKLSHQITLIILSLALLFETACNDLVLGEEQSSIDPYTNLQYLWQQANEKYTYFDYKEIDWNEVKTKYVRKMYKNMSQDSLFHVLGAMLNELKDGHVNLVSTFNVSHYPFERKGQDNFDFRLIEDYYLPVDYYISGPLKHDLIADKNIVYLRMNSFTGGVSRSNMGFVLAKYKNTRGMIIDLRENGGGVVLDVFDLLSYFVKEKTLVYKNQKKSGPGNNEFSKEYDVYIKPSKEEAYKGKIIMLTDRGTYSSGSLTALAARALPNITTMGDTTGGGLGAPNGGQLPNGWRYRFSVSRALDLYGNNFEDGVPPEIVVQMDWKNKEKDEIIERAIQEILK